MVRRRMLLSALALASMTASCRFFKPINPSQPAGPPREQRAEESRPAEEVPAATAPAEKPAAPAQRAQAAPRQASGPISDGNIAAMVLASNNTDISYARLVPTRAQRDDVKEFARRMLTDHNGVNALVTEFLRKADITPEDNVASLDMRDESAEKRDLMRELSEFPFDSTYMENEVAYHRKFLAAIDEVMIPRARNTDLRTLLMNIRPAVAAHLAHAEQIRANVLAKK